MSRKQIFITTVLLSAAAIIIWYLRPKNDNKTIMINTKSETINKFGNTQIENGITNYLLTQRRFSWKTGSDSRNFCTIDNLMPEKMLFPLYIWAYCAEYSLQEGKLKELSGFSGPLKIDYPNELSFYDLARFSYEAPSDGTSYSSDIKRIFPTDIQHAVFSYDVREIKSQNEAKAGKSF